MVEEKVPKTEDPVDTENVEEKTSKATSEETEKIPEETKTAKVAKTKAKAAKAKAKKISPEKKKKLDTVEKHIDDHIAPMSQKVVDRTEVNRELKSKTPKEEKKSIWQKIKGIF